MSPLGISHPPGKTWRLLRSSLCAIFLNLVTALICQAEDRTPPTYELQVATFYPTKAENPEQIFTIGPLAFHSMKDLKKFLSLVPKGSTLQWAPGCVRTTVNELLSSEEELKELRNYCDSVGIDFVHVPSG